MNRGWAERWLSLFAGQTDTLIGLYADRFDFEDVNLGVRIVDDKEALRGFFRNFASPETDQAYNRFEVDDYLGDDRFCAVQWTWRAKHEGDFLGIPAAGIETETRGMTVLGFRDGRIVTERAVWDVLPILRRLGAVAPA